jgi:hypothetical protein
LIIWLLLVVVAVLAHKAPDQLVAAVARVVS